MGTAEEIQAQLLQLAIIVFFVGWYAGDAAWKEQAPAPPFVNTSMVGNEGSAVADADHESTLSSRLMGMVWWALSYSVFSEEQAALAETISATMDSAAQP